MAVAADYAYARQSLTAMVAKSWFVATEAGLQQSIARDMLRASEALLRLAQERMRIGNGNEQAVAEARASAAGYRDTPVGGFGALDDLLAGYESESGIRVDAEHVRFWEVFGSFWWAVGISGRL